ncbi:MAG: PilX N-terminal domain-containing pilus assembly protein [Dokdonella sp.]
MKNRFVKNPISFNPGSVCAQRGAVLFVALIFLVLLTLLALTATSTSILQEKMTGGMRNRQLGLMGSESGLRGGEAFLFNLSFNAATGQPLPPCATAVVYAPGTNCVYRPTPHTGVLNAGVQKFRTQQTWINTAPAGAPAYVQTLTGLTGSVETASLAAQPLLSIEDLGADTPPGAGGQSGIIDPERQGGPGTAWLYRITSRSQGGSEAVVSAAESVFAAANLTNTGIEPPPLP